MAKSRKRTFPPRPGEIGLILLILLTSISMFLVGCVAPNPIPLPNESPDSTLATRSVSAINHNDSSQTTNSTAVHVAPLPGSKPGFRSKKRDTQVSYHKDYRFEGETYDPKPYHCWASYYASRFQGRKTACGERYDPEAYTCAHRSLPFGSVLKVTNLSNDKSVEVRVNDRVARGHKREIDLSKRAARDLDMLRDGIVLVRIELVTKNSDDTSGR